MKVSDFLKKYNEYKSKLDSTLKSEYSYTDLENLEQLGKDLQTDKYKLEATINAKLEEIERDICKLTNEIEKDVPGIKNMTKEEIETLIKNELYLILDENLLV